LLLKNIYKNDSLIAWRLACLVKVILETVPWAANKQ